MYLFSREYIKNNVLLPSVYILLHVFVYVKEKILINKVIYYTVKICYLYTLYVKVRWERERDPLCSTITHQCFSYYDPISVLEFLNFSTTFVYEYITRMACLLCWLQGEWWRELKKHAPENSHENQPLPQSPSDLCAVWGVSNRCHDHCGMPPFL